MPNRRKLMTKLEELKVIRDAAVNAADEVPCKSILIDLIPEADWLDASVENWKIEVGSNEHDENELDASDEHLLKRAAA